MADGTTKYTIDIQARTNEAQANLSDVRNRLKNLAEDVKKNNIGRTIQSSMANIEQAFDELDLTYEQVKKKLEALHGQMADPSASDREKASIEAEIRVYDALKAQIEGTADELEQYRDRLGQNADAADSTRTRLREMREELARMREAGKTNTEAYRELAERYADLKNHVGEASKTFSGLQGAVAGTISGISGLTGAMNVAVGVTGMLGKEDEDLQKIMVKIQSLMSVTMGLQAVANTLNKQSALQQNIINPLKARYNAILARQAAAQAAANTATTAGVKALNRMKAAILSIPGVGWIIAIATALAAATVAIMKATGETKRFVEAQKQANELEKAHNEYIGKSSELRTEELGKETEAAKRQLEIMKAQNAPLEEQEKLQAKILEAEAYRANWEKGYYGASEKRLKEINKELASLYELQEQLTGSNDRKVVFEGRKIKREDATDIVEGRITNLENRKKQYNDIIKASEDAEAAITRNLAEQAEKRKEISRREYAARMQTESMRLAAMAGGYARDRAELRFAAQQQKDALYLTIGDKNSTQAQRNEAAKQVKLVDAKLYQDLAELKRQHDKEILSLHREHEDNMLSAIGDTADAQRQALKTKYARMREDLQAEIDAAKAAGDTAKQSANEQLLADTDAAEKKESAELEIQHQRDVLAFKMYCIEKNKEVAKEGSRELYNYEMQLLNMQMEDEIAANKQKVAEMQEDEQAIRDRYAAKRLKATNSQSVAEAKERLRLSQANRQAELETWEQSERAKNILALELQAEQLEETLRLHEQYNTEMTDADVQETRNALAQVRSELKKAKEQTSLWDIIEDALGISLNDNIKGKITTAFNYLKSAAKSVTKDLAELGAISETTSKNLEYAVTTIENVVAGASTGASAGGWIGAIVGAVVGLGTSVLEIFTKEKQLERAAAEQAKKDVEDLKGRIKDLKKEFADIDIFGTKNMDWSKFEDEFGKAAKYYEEIKAIKAKMAAADASSGHRTNIQGSSSLNSDMPLDFYEQTKMMLEEELVESTNKAAEAISGLFNGIGSDILDMLNDTSNGAEELLADFTDSLGSYVRQWVSQMMFFELIKPELDRLESDLKDSLKQAISTGDMSVFTDKLTETSNELAGLAKGWVNIRDLVTEKMQPFYDQFGGSPASGSASGMTGAVSGMSAETASLLAGQLTAMRLSAANIDSAMQQTLYHVSNIHTNTDRMAADIAEIKNGIKYNQRTNAY